MVLVAGGWGGGGTCCCAHLMTDCLLVQFNGSGAYKIRTEFGSRDSPSPLPSFIEKLDREGCDVLSDSVSQC